jgi:hypothetical protein
MPGAHAVVTGCAFSGGLLAGRPQHIPLVAEHLSEELPPLLGLPLRQ